MKRNPAKVITTLIGLMLVLSLTTIGALAQDVPIIRGIKISGNVGVDSDTIKTAILKTKVGDVVVEQRILDDLRSIYDLGYFQDVAANFDLSDAGVVVIFEVEENPLVQEVVFDGPEVIPFSDFTKLMKTRAGYVLNVHDLWEDLRDMREWVAGEHGYLLRVVDLGADIDGIVRIDLAETRIKEIVIEGNEKTRDYVIERELGLKPGQPVNLKQIDQGLRKVLMLGFFEEISRDFSEEEDPDETVLTVSVKEQKTGSAVFGVAYGSKGLVGYLEAADENFLGRGQRVNASFEIGKGTTTYELGFHEPYIDKTGTSMGIDLYRRSSSILKNAEKPNELKGNAITIGGNLTIGRPLAESTRGRLMFRLENTDIRKETGDVNDPEWPADYKNRIVGLGVNTNTVDHPLYPTEGFKNDVYLELAGKLLGGTSQYAKVQLEHSRFFQLKEGGYVLALRGMGGRQLQGVLPDNAKFRLGGPDTLRGYESNNDFLKGDGMVLLNAEFRFPILDKVTGVVFSDWGKTWNVGDKFDLANLNSSFGLGVRLDTPLGLLRLDYGFGKDELQNRRGQFYFGLGQTF